MAHLRHQLPLRDAVGVADADGLCDGGAVFFLRGGVVALQGHQGLYAVCIGLLIDETHKFLQKFDGDRNVLIILQYIVPHFWRCVKHRDFL